MAQLGIKIRALGFVGLGIWLAILGAAYGQHDSKGTAYAYADTRALVRLVEDAAALVEQQGPAVFSEFSRRGSRWLTDESYIFVYDLDGVCVQHSATPELIGVNLSKMHDMNGKPVIQMITDIARKPEPDAHGWVFYLWEDKVQLIPLWKSSYIRKVVAPNGQVYALGSGLYDIKIEEAFIKERVDMAVAYLQTQGKEAAFNAFRDTASPFFFLDTYIFVMDQHGRTLVDPAFPTMIGRDLSQLKDAVGRPLVQEVFQKLRQSDEAWVQYMWPRPGVALPSRKLAYVRKVKLGTETLVVGSDFFMATPIWMKL